MKAHRFALILDGRDPGALGGLHHCDNPPCVRPEHLYVGTNVQNIADKVARGRSVRRYGAANWATKLTPSQVDEIRQRHAAGEGMRALGREFGVTHRTIGLAVRGLTHAR